MFQPFIYSNFSLSLSFIDHTQMFIVAKQRTNSIAKTHGTSDCLEMWSICSLATTIKSWLVLREGWVWGWWVCKVVWLVVGCSLEFKTRNHVEVWSILDLCCNDSCRFLTLARSGGKWFLQQDWRGFFPKCQGNLSIVF